MEAEEIEIWYEEQKQKLSDRYIKSIEKRMPLARREQVFDRAMVKLNNRYNKRQSSLLKRQKLKKEWTKKKAELLEPLYETGIALNYSSMMLLGGVRDLLSAGYHSMRFHMGMFWTTKGYKIGDGMKRRSRPAYLIYAKHLKYPLIVLTKPFVKTGNWLSKSMADSKDRIKDGAKVSWKGMRVAGKSIAKYSVMGYKKVDGWYEAVHKRHTEWYAKRVQASLDRKHDTEEKKKQRLKEKEEAKENKS